MTAATSARPQYAANWRVVGNALSCQSNKPRHKTAVLKSTLNSMLLPDNASPDARQNNK